MVLTPTICKKGEFFIMYKKTKVKRVLELIKDGKSNLYISDYMHTSRNTVIAIRSKLNAQNLDLDDLLKMDDDELYHVFYPTKFIENDDYEQPDLAYIHSELKKVGVTMQLLWEEYVDKCNCKNTASYCYATFTRLYANYTNRKSFSSRIVHKPGEKVEVDWSGPTMYVTDYDSKKKIKAYLFVGVLPYSQYAYVEARYSMNQEDWLNCHINMFKSFEGVPLQIVCDNLKTGVIEHPKFGEIVLNEDYLSLAEHYKTSILPARVRKPKDKASAEGTVGKIATCVIASLRNEIFYSLEALNKAIKEQVDKFNNKKFQKKDGSRSIIFNLEEKQTLLPLPTLPYEVCKWVYERKVNNNSHILYKHNFYSVPCEYIGKHVDLKIWDKKIDIIYKRELIASHQLFNNFKKGQYQTNHNHLPNESLFKPWTLEEVLEYGEKIGPNTLEVFNRLIDGSKIKQQALLSIVPIIDKSKAYPSDIFECACKEALDNFTLPHYRNIKSCLDKLEKPKKIESKTSKNVRGANYYKKGN